MRRVHEVAGKALEAGLGLLIQQLVVVFGVFEMGRKPFWPRYRSDKVWEIGVHVASARPELMSRIAECLTLWPFVELELAVLLGMLLGSKTDAALAMFATMRGYRNQRDAIEAAASAVGTEAETELVSAVLDVIHTASRARDDMAHGLWGMTRNLPDAMLWVEPKYAAPWTAGMILKEDDPTRPTHDDLARRLFVYTREDIAADRNKIIQAWTVTQQLASYFRIDKSLTLERGQLYVLISNEPPVLEALNRLRKVKSKK